MTKINTSDKRINYFGRINRSSGKPVFTWPGCMLRLNFVGTTVCVKFTQTWGWGQRKIGVVLDGKELSFPIVDGENEIVIAKDLENTHHSLVIYKMMEGHYFSLDEIMTDGDITDPDPLPTRKIEVYGDSVSAGSVVDCVEYEGKCDPENHNGQFDNSWHAYPLIMARKMPAQVYVTSQGGIAIFNNTGYFEMPKMTGMESCWDKACYCTNAPTTQWDFSFKPHVIVFAIGQNDSHPDPDCLNNPDYYKKWTDKYIEIAENVRKHSPDATIVFALTVLMHAPVWDDALEDVKNRMGGEDNKVYHFTYSRCGKATPGHPRIPEQEEMAEELTAFLNGLPFDTWKN